MKKLIIILTMLAAPWFLSAQSIDISTGAVTTIGVGASISVGTAASPGAITNTANTDLIIKSTSSGSGSLICSGTPNATVERFVDYGTSGRWNMVSPSTTGVTGQTFFGASGSASWLVWFDESTGTGNTPGTGWTYHPSLSDPVSVGVGYSYYPSEDETVNFKGNLQSANLSPTLAWTDASHGYNLIGNPFSSAVQWNNDVSWSMNATDMELTIWIWDGSQYSAKPNSTSFDIPVGQGFFVRAKTASGAITIPASQKLHSSQSFLKNGENTEEGIENSLIINAQNNQYQDKIQISFGENGTNGFDNGWDATKMFGSPDAPQIYLVEQNIKQSFDHLPTLVEGVETVVAMSYIAGADGLQALIADFTYLTNSDVTLEDLKTGITQDLRETPVYNFTGSKEDNPARFLLHFTWSPDGINDTESATDPDVTIYASGKMVYIKSKNDALNTRGELSIYDIYGRTIVSRQLNRDEVQSVSVDQSNVYLIVRVIKQGKVYTEKVFIN